MRLIAQLTLKGIHLGDYNSKKLRDYAKSHIGDRVAIETITPESREQRGFLHGAVYPLWIYLNDGDYRDSSLIEWVHEEGKREFNGELVVWDGKTVKRGKSTKGELAKGYVDRVIDFLEEQYGIDRFKVLSTDDYKYYRDVIYSNPDAPEDYISYLKATEILN